MNSAWLSIIEISTKTWDFYLREGKSHSNCSNNHKMIPEPFPHCIQATSYVDFIF